MRGRISAVVCLVLAALFWAIGGVSWKIFGEMGFAFIFVFWLSRIFKFLAVLFASYCRVRAHEPVRNRREMAIIFINALFSLTTPFFFVLALAYTKISNAYFLQFTMSAWVLVFAVLFLGEKASPRKALGMLLVICGISLIARPEDVLSFSPGVLFGVLSALSYAGDIITARELKGYSYHTVAVYSNGMQFLIATVALPFFVPALPWPEVSPIGLLGIVAFGIMLGVASDLYYHALHTLQASTAAIIAHLELLFGSSLAFLLFSEVPTGLEMAGYALITAASFVIILRGPPQLPHFERLLHLADKQ